MFTVVRVGSKLLIYLNLTHFRSFSDPFRSQKSPFFHSMSNHLLSVLLIYLIFALFGSYLVHFLSISGHFWSICAHFRSQKSLLLKFLCPFSFNVNSFNVSITDILHFGSFLDLIWSISGPFPAHFRSLPVPKYLQNFFIACGCPIFEKESRNKEGI